MECCYASRGVVTLIHGDIDQVDYFSNIVIVTLFSSSLLHVVLWQLWWFLYEKQLPPWPGIHFAAYSSKTWELYDYFRYWMLAFYLGMGSYASFSACLSVWPGPNIILENIYMYAITPWGSRKYCTRWGLKKWCHKIGKMVCNSTKSVKRWHRLYFFILTKKKLNVDLLGSFKIALNFG